MLGGEAVFWPERWGEVLSEMEPSGAGAGSGGLPREAVVIVSEM